MAFRWSASRLLLYLRCPRAYFLKYKKKVSVPIPSYLVFGKAIHKGIKILHQGNPHQRFEPTEERPLFFKDAQAFGGFWIGLLQREVEKTEKETGIRWKNDEEKDSLKSLGWAMLAGTKDSRWRGYYNTILKPPFPIKILEWEFRIRTDLFSRFPVTAVIDQIWETPEGTAIVDFTTGRSSNVKFLQMTFYHEVLKEYCRIPKARKRFGSGPKGYYIWNLRDEKLIPTSPQNSAKLREMLEFSTTGVHLGEFHETQQDDVCRYCEYAEICEKTIGKPFSLKRENGEKLQISLPLREKEVRLKQLHFKKGMEGKGGWRGGTLKKKKTK